MEHTKFPASLINAICKFNMCNISAFNLLWPIDAISMG